MIQPRMNMIFLVDGDNNIRTGPKGVALLSDPGAVLVLYQTVSLPLAKPQTHRAPLPRNTQHH